VISGFRRDIDEICLLLGYYAVYSGRWAGSVARMVESTGVYRVSVGKPEGKGPLGRPRIDGRIILRWIVRKRDVGV
jgi:hypothetical protein